MRYINPDDIELCKPASWDADVLGWKQRVRVSASKNTELTTIGNKWRDFKPGFIRNFGDKCWYTETPRYGAPNDVDHFRPKNAVKDKNGNYVSRSVQGNNKKHTGYWWLAFEPQNYRYSCIFSNRLNGNGGKHDFFPISDESTRAWSPSCSYIHEQKSLLDPCDIEDVQLIVFDQTPGYAFPRDTKETNSTNYERFQLSKKYYQLNEKTIKGARLRRLTELGKDLLLLENCWNLNADAQLTLDDNIRAAKAGIIESCNRKSDFSSAAVSLIKTKIAEEWLQELIPQLDLTP